MLSAVIRNGHSYRAVPLAGQLVHHRSAHPGPLVLGATPLNSPARTLDRDRLLVTRPAGFLFPLVPCVAAGIRPYLLDLSRVRRMACEDSSSFNRCCKGCSRHSSCLRIHRVGDVHDLKQPTLCEMFAVAHSAKNVFEALERLAFDHESAIAEGNDLSDEAFEISNDVLQRPIPSSGSRVWRDCAAAESLLESS